MKHHVNKFLGFTLAEVLITLGIISIVAALTIPALIGNYQKQETITSLKKAYSIINQAKTLSTIDNGEFEYWDNTLPPEQYLNKYWTPYFKGAIICFEHTQCGYKESKPWESPNWSYTQFAYPDFRVPFITEDGILYSISLNDTQDTDIGKKLILIDTNGPKRPNKSGNDFFFLIRTDEGKIMPYGYDKSPDEIDANCISGNKEYCAAKIFKDGWTITKDYPW